MQPNIYSNTDMDESIYINTEGSKIHFAKIEQKALDRSPGTQPTASKSSQKQPYRWATVCLGLLCILLMAALAVLSVYYARAHDVHTKYNASKIENEQLRTKWSLAVAEIVQLQASYNSCSSSEQQLKKKVCPAGWNSFASRCYYMSTEKKNWNESQNFCKREGADLVIINSKKEQAFLNLFHQPFWIGLSDQEVEGTWKWVDGTIMPKEKGTWRPAQPDDHQGSEDCIEDTIGEPDPEKRWNDLSCQTPMRWVCEKALGI